jgi:hypothetical protein
LISSIGLATLCVSAARGSFRNGIAILLEVTIFTVIIAGLLGGVYRFEKETLLNQLSMRPSLLQPLLFLVVWLAAAAGVPFILALLGCLIGLPFRLRRRKKQ